MANNSDEHSRLPEHSSWPEARELFAEPGPPAAERECMRPARSTASPLHEHCRSPTHEWHFAKPAHLFAQQPQAGLRLALRSKKGSAVWMLSCVCSAD